MSDYYPDCWVIVKFTGSAVGPEPLYKVLAGWYGGFARGDSWKLNSGVVGVKVEDTSYSFEGSSGSVYHCHTTSERLSNLTASTYNWFIEQNKDRSSEITIEIVSVQEVLEYFK